MPKAPYKDKARTLRPIRDKADLRGIARECAGCARTFTPAMSEAICPACVRSIVADPVPWLDLLARSWLPG